MSSNPPRVCFFVCFRFFQSNLLTPYQLKPAHFAHLGCRYGILPKCKTDKYFAYGTYKKWRPLLSFLACFTGKTDELRTELSVKRYSYKKIRCTYFGSKAFRGCWMLITDLQHYIRYIAWTIFLVTWGVTLKSLTDTPSTQSGRFKSGGC